MTYMNNSGQPLVAVADFYKISPEDILVVADDMALPLGKLRMRLEGGTGGGYVGGLIKGISFGIRAAEHIAKSLKG